jgi:hypothetical protein
MDVSGLPTPPITPPINPPSQVPVEDPQIQKPVNPTMKSVKRNFPKLVVGALMAVLLIGGAIFGVSEVQKRQVAEQKAWDGPDVPECTNQTVNNNNVIEGCILETCTNPVAESSGYPDCVEWGAVCRIKDCDKNGVRKKCPNGQPPICTNPPVYFCVSCSSNIANAILTCYNANFPNQFVSYGDGYCPIGQFKFQECTCNIVASPSPSPSGSPEPSPSPSVSPSPSPSPELSCVGLTKDIAAPVLNSAVTFTCEANFSGTSPIAYFSHSLNGSPTYIIDPIAYPIDITTKTASKTMTINQLGSWNVQCRVCTDTTATTCTTWGLAN